jgi:hypothetical protein
MVISEIIVDVVDDGLVLIIHWQGGDHTRLTVKRNRPGQTRWATDDDIVDLVRALARQMPDQTIAALLNRSGKSTGYGKSWTRSRICSLRRQHQIAVYREGERADRGEATLHEAATALALSTTTIRRLIAKGILPASQHCKGAPWIIRLADLERDEVRLRAGPGARRLMGARKISLIYQSHDEMSTMKHPRPSRRTASSSAPAGRRRLSPHLGHAQVGALAKSSRITQSGPAPPAQVESQLATKAVMLLSSFFNSLIFPRTVARCACARSRASMQERSRS